MLQHGRAHLSCPAGMLNFRESFTWHPTRNSAGRMIRELRCQVSRSSFVRCHGFRNCEFYDNERHDHRRWYKRLRRIFICEFGWKSKFADFTRDACMICICVGVYGDFVRSWLAAAGHRITHEPKPTTSREDHCPTVYPVKNESRNVIN